MNGIDSTCLDVDEMERFAKFATDASDALTRAPGSGDRGSLAEGRPMKIGIHALPQFLRVTPLSGWHLQIRWTA